MALTRFLRRISGVLSFPQPGQTDGDLVSTTLGTGVGRSSGWSLQRLEWDWWQPPPGGPGTWEYARYYIERMQVMDGNYGYGFRLNLTTAESGEALYKGRISLPWSGGPTETTHTWPGQVWPIVHEFAKGVVVVDPGIVVEAAMDNVDRSDIQLRWAIYYTLLQLDPDDLVFLRSSRQ